MPFGETIPAKPVFGWFIRNVLAIPLATRRPAPPNSRRSLSPEERVAVNICYEDAFGGELLDGAARRELLVNVTNDAWYGRSIAAYQHNQIAAMRALELGRPMLRATNTGITSAIAHDGPRRRANCRGSPAASLEIDDRRAHGRHAVPAFR